MPLSTKLDRTLRAAEDSSDGEEYYQVTDRSSSASLIETGDGGHVISSDDDAGDSEVEGTRDGVDEGQVHARLSSVSFGALARAQDVLSQNSSTGRKRKRGEEGSASQLDKLQALRERLRQIKAEKLAAGAPSTKTAKKPPGNSGRSAATRSRPDNDTDDSDSDGPPHARSSKHAPAVQSSKRMVSRKRKVVDVKKPVFRDPRFDNVSGPSPDENTVGKRYSFLNDYRASEIAELRTTVKKAKNEDEKDRLKKKLLSMESQEQTRKRKEEQQNVVRDHRKREKELVQQGKQPFYLKKSEQKKIALVDRFQGMKSKQRDKVIERRRKKATAKERRNMPDERRTAS